MYDAVCERMIIKRIPLYDAVCERTIPQYKQAVTTDNFVKNEFHFVYYFVEL